MLRRRLPANLRRKMLKHHEFKSSQVLLFCTLASWIVLPNSKIDPRLIIKFKYLLISSVYKLGPYLRAKSFCNLRRPGRNGNTNFSHFVPV